MWALTVFLWMTENNIDDGMEWKSQNGIAQSTTSRRVIIKWTESTEKEHYEACNTLV